MLYYIVFWTIFCLAILSILRVIFKQEKSNAWLGVILFILCITMAIPGYEVEIHLPGGVVAKAKSSPRLVEMLAKQKVTSFELENPTGETQKAEIRLQSNAAIESIALNKVPDVFTIKDGGIGNNYAVYEVTIPPGQSVSGSAVSSNTVVLATDI